MKGAIIITGMLLVAGMAACKKEERVMTKKEIVAKADSIIATRMDELNRQAEEDLDRRMSIEVKAKADSIVDAYRLTILPPDSSQR